ncbi:MAG: TRAP transporter small permease subunit [Chloroflexota bacterium]
MQDFLRKYVNFVEKLTNGFGGITVYLVIITVVIGFYNVAARYLGRFIGMQLSSNLFIELQWYLYSLVFLWGFAYALRHGVNVRVDFIYANWPKKRKATLDFWGHLFFLLPFTVMGIYVTVRPVLTSWGLRPNGTWGSMEWSPDPSGLPRAPIKTMLIVAFVLLLLQTVAELIKLWWAMRGRDEFGIVEAEAPLRIE